MSEPTSAIPAGGEDPQNLSSVTPGGELPMADPESAAALDKMFLEATDGEGDSTSKPAAPAPAPEPPAAPAPAPEPPAAPAPAPEPPAAPPAPEPAAPKDRFDEVALPPYTKAKAAESFATVKTIAREEIAQRDKALAELKAERDRLAEEAKKVGKLTPETEKELEELRAFRAKLDVEADPKFKEWDNRVAENDQSIYNKLTAAGTAPEVIAKIKEMGGPSVVDWDKLTEKMPGHIKHYIQGKVFENEDLTEKKAKALAEAKSKANEYVKERAESASKEVEGRRKGVEAKVAELSPNIEWLQEKKPVAGAKPEEVAAAEAHNKRAGEIRATMREAIENDSPEMKGLLVLGIAQLQRVNGEFDEFKKASAAEKAALEAKLKDVTDRLDKIKKSSTGRISSSAPAAGEPKPVKQNYNEDPGDALDRRLKEALAAQT